jgi:hypothetical protein
MGGIRLPRITRSGEVVQVDDVIEIAGAVLVQPGDASPYAPDAARAGVGIRRHRAPL